MGDDSTRSSILTLKEEWNLFWDGLSQPNRGTDFRVDELPALTAENLRILSKSLSEERKKINQKLEYLKKEIEMVSLKVETLKMVGAAEDESGQRISELSDQGEKLIQQLSKVDERLKVIRQYPL